MNVPAPTRKFSVPFDQIMAVDAAWCRKRMAAIQRGRKDRETIARLEVQLTSRIEQSRLMVDARKAALPVPEYDPGLPITSHRDEILAAMASHQVVVVAGETGSGKTTQLPKICLEAGRGARGLIACTQPRRIAARAMAERVSEELNSELGGVVGYQVRFRERSSSRGYIKFMTDGILLAESIHDRFLDAYDTIIIDEAHERSLNIDFLLGYLKTLLPRRPDMKLLITSATIDTGKFSRHFDDAPVIEVSGRGYPVDIVYRPLPGEQEASGPGDRDLYQGIADACRQLSGIDPLGDVLVFLSGEREIREAADFLQKQNLRSGPAGTETLPLYARLSATEQRRVFHPGKMRRIILATNVAETSLTVPRIRFVIDSGAARISRYSHRSRIQRLPIEAISQASANQRSGRCGRLGPGTCIRLYSEEDFNGRPEFTEPEILRTSLASVILRMLSMGLGSVEDFPFVDRPAPRMINDAYQLLFELQAIDKSRSTTRLGKSLARWPVDVRLGRMIEEGARKKCLEDLLVLAAALSIQDPRERPLEAQSQADEAHQRFVDEKSDFMTLLRLWQYLREKRKSISGNQFRKLCRRDFLNWQRVLEWFDLYQQLRDQAREQKLPLTGLRGDHQQIHLSLLAGLLSHCGRKHPEDRSYTGARSSTYHIFPGSGLFGSTPKWLMSAEIVDTSKPYARINAGISPDWIERQAQHLLKRHYSEPHWSRRHGAVFAWEQVTLYGLVVVEKRRIRFAPVDADKARRIFILEGLVRGALDTRAAFKSHNEQIRSEVEALENKRRKRDVLADENTLFEFFDARVPEKVNSAKSFEKWLSGLGNEGRELLFLGHDVLTRENAGAAPHELFPDVFEAAGRHFPLEYHFDPGNPDDGVHLTVPIELLNTLNAGSLQGLVPGLLKDKLIALFRQLPKPMRRSLTPIPEFADAVQESIVAHSEESMLASCAAELRRMTGLEIDEDDLDERSISPHFRFLVRVVDEEGELIDSGRDLLELQARLGDQAQRQFMDQQGQNFNRDGAKAWVFGDLEEAVNTADGARAWPALIDQQTSAGLRLFDTWEEAVLSHVDGVLRLLQLVLPDRMSYLRKHHGLSRESLLAWSAHGRSAELIEDLLQRSLVDCAGDVSMIRGTAAFEKLCQRVRNEIGQVNLHNSALLNQALPLLAEVSLQLTGDLEHFHPGVFADISGQLEDLVYPGFLAMLEPGRLQHYPRYLKAVRDRLHQLGENPARDLQRMALIEPWWHRYLDALERGCAYHQPLDQYRWLLEEYRVSLFAQRLGTAQKVSEKRLADAWKRTGY
jgi:ATP-dependent helicase HrpA